MSPKPSPWVVTDSVFQRNFSYGQGDAWRNCRGLALHRNGLEANRLTLEANELATEFARTTECQRDRPGRLGIHENWFSADERIASSNLTRPARSASSRTERVPASLRTLRVASCRPAKLIDQHHGPSQFARERDSLAFSEVQLRERDGGSWAHDFEPEGAGSRSGR